MRTITEKRGSVLEKINADSGELLRKHEAMQYTSNAFMSPQPKSFPQQSSDLLEQTTNTESKAYGNVDMRSAEMLDPASQADAMLKMQHYNNGQSSLPNVHQRSSAKKHKSIE